MGLAGVLMLEQCTASVAGEYIGAGITKLSVWLAGALMQGQCTASGAGRCTGGGITKIPIELAGTPV